MIYKREKRIKNIIKINNKVKNISWRILCFFSWCLRNFFLIDFVSYKEKLLIF